MNYKLGLVGHPVKASLSPAMHEAALAHQKIPGNYELIDLLPQQLESKLSDLIASYNGFNVTIPHKQVFYSLVTELTPEAKRLKAVNTIKVKSKECIVGHNTDLGGFIAAISNANHITNDSGLACIVGCGGAASAAIWSLLDLGWNKIQIVARNQQSANEMITDVNRELRSTKMQGAFPRLSLISTELSGIDRMPDLLINCTPLGSAETTLPEWLIELLRWMNPQGTVFDMVYSRDGKSTGLIAEAKKLRLNCFDGTEMLIHQAALAFEYWTEKKAPVEQMREALIKARHKEAQ